MAKPEFKRVASFQTVEAFRDYLRELEVEMPVDDKILTTAAGSPLGDELVVPFHNGEFTVGNRGVIHPMEGWDGTEEGNPTADVYRRWGRFGTSGAKTIWGGEAVAVSLNARANPNQLSLREENIDEFGNLRHHLVESHIEKFGSVDDLLVGLQITHSGRFCKPFDKKKMEPVLVYAHPVLNEKFGLEMDHPVLTDKDILEIIKQYRQSAKLAYEAGFQFVDIKHCHGYLLHEFLSARERQGEYGGPFENRTRPLREIVEGIQQDVPDLGIGVRLSAFDFAPFFGKKGTKGAPKAAEGYHGFGGASDNPVDLDLEETFQFMEVLKELGVNFVNLSAGSPYYNPHIQRPALFPPSDGYDPPEDPLVGVARQMDVCHAVKKMYPELVVVGSALTYLQEYFPQVVQAAIRDGMMDAAGIGRMALSYPDIFSDILENGQMQRKNICRTFSECTTSVRPWRNNEPGRSGCFPLDPHYRDSPDFGPERKLIRIVKTDLKNE